MGGSKTAIFTQVVHFYSDGVGHITIGGNTLMKFTSEVALRAPWPQVVTVGEALAVPLTSAEEEDLLPYLCWPRADI
jgi:hypothetical protein